MKEIEQSGYAIMRRSFRFGDILELDRREWQLLAANWAKTMWTGSYRQVSCACYAWMRGKLLIEFGLPGILAPPERRTRHT
jgi:hypothetical protein